MRTACAACGKILQKEDGGRRGTSHGICRRHFLQDVIAADICAWWEVAVFPLVYFAWRAELRLFKSHFDAGAKRV